MTDATIIAPAPETFEDRQVDNEGFFQVMEEKLPEILSSAEVRERTRLDLKELIMSMKKREIIKGVTEWTAVEQKSFFEKVQSEIINSGVLFSTQVREKIQEIIEQEIWREINDDGLKYSLHDGDGNVLIQDMGNSREFLRTSFLVNIETTIVPLDLHLTVNETESVEGAENKLNRYRGKYNALVLVDTDNRPMGVVRSDMLAKYREAGNTKLSGIQYIPQVFGYYKTSSQDAKNIMQEHSINILPIIDKDTNILIGILTNDTLVRKDMQYYSTKSLTELKLDLFQDKNFTIEKVRI